MIATICDGPDCGSNVPADRAEDDWIFIHGVDIRTVEFCSVLCASRYLATCVAFAPHQPNLFEDLLFHAEPPC